MSLTTRGTPRHKTTSASQGITSQKGTGPAPRSASAALTYGHPVQSTTDGQFPVDSERVFIISPFTPDMEPVYLAIARAARAVGLHAERVKDMPGDYRITGLILTMIERARFIVADLTHERPNVYYELGYARALGKTVITIQRAGTTAHFDVYDWTCLEYIDSRPLERDLRKRLRFELQAS